MNSIFRMLINTIKVKFQRIYTKIRYWTDPVFIKTKLLVKVRQWLNKIFNVKPRNKKDYYTVLNWLVSKKLVHAIVVIIGLLCAMYLFFVNPVFDTSKMKSGQRVYAYSSIPLKFVEGNVKIKAKAGYIAYDGAVSKGYATGQGNLYDSNGNLIYNGQFEKNQFSGMGTLYYPVGQRKYVGEFRNNLFNGTGEFFRENGTKLYSGEFENGYQEGNGILYDGSENQIFEGSFHRDEIVYSQLLNKTAADISQMYNGTQKLYTYSEQNVVELEDIDAFYVSESGEDSLDDSITAGAVYIAKNSIAYGAERISEIEDLKEIFGEPVYEGNSYISFPEAVVIDELQNQGKAQGIYCELEKSPVYDELTDVESYSQDTLIYLYVFNINDLNYSFVSNDKNSGFFMYSIENG